MSIFNGQRLTNETFKLDVERMRAGWYSDKYFENVGRLLAALSAEERAVLLQRSDRAGLLHLAVHWARSPASGP